MVQRKKSKSTDREILPANIDSHRDEKTPIHTQRHVYRNYEEREKDEPDNRRRLRETQSNCVNGWYEQKIEKGDCFAFDEREKNLVFVAERNSNSKEERDFIYTHLIIREILSGKK